MSSSLKTSSLTAQWPARWPPPLMARSSTYGISAGPGDHGQLGRQGTHCSTAASPGLSIPFGSTQLSQAQESSATAKDMAVRPGYRIRQELHAGCRAQQTPPRPHCNLPGLPQDLRCFMPTGRGDEYHRSGLPSHGDGQIAGNRGKAHIPHPFPSLPQLLWAGQPYQDFCYLDPMQMTSHNRHSPTPSWQARRAPNSTSSGARLLVWAV